ncbi:MAG: hypothetical protein ACE5EE_09695 [Fidelibacterota bacterium]
MIPGSPTGRLGITAWKSTCRGEDFPGDCSFGPFLASRKGQRKGNITPSLKGEKTQSPDINLSLWLVFSTLLMPTSQVTGGGKDHGKRIFQPVPDLCTGQAGPRRPDRFRKEKKPPPGEGEGSFFQS